MMTEKRANRAGQGTFAKLYDVHEQMSQRNTRPLGRPRKKIQRKPTTVHLTQSEIRSLSQLHLSINEQFSANRSELIGVAIDTLTFLLQEKGDKIIKEAEIRSVEALREAVFDFIKS